LNAVLNGLWAGREGYIEMDSKFKIKGAQSGVILAGVFCVFALMLFLVTKKVPSDPQFRWADYYRAYHLVGGASLVAGIFWLVFAFLKAKTDFFNVNMKITSDELNISIAFVAIAVVVGIYLTLTNLPVLTPAPEVSMDPAERAKLMRWDQGLKCLAWTVVLFTGSIVISLPLRRYFRR